MALKSLFLMSLIVGVLAVGAPMAQAQLGGVGGIIGSLLGLIRINGIVPCLLNSTTSLINGTIPLFPNAVVQLKCGGNVVSSATTNQNGVFSILLDPLHYILSTVLNTCQLEVPTPLSNCNSALPVTGIPSQHCSSPETLSRDSSASPTSFLLDSISLAELYGMQIGPDLSKLG